MAALAAALLLASCGGVGRREHVRRNAAILAALPVFPGAVKTHEFSTPEYGKGEASGPTGYTTTVVYRLPAGTRASSVRRFYGATLGRRGWRSSATGTQAIVDFKRGRMLTVVNTITLLRSSTYLVAVDSGR